MYTFLNFLKSIFPTITFLQKFTLFNRHDSPCSERYIYIFPYFSLDSNIQVKSCRTNACTNVACNRDVKESQQGRRSSRDLPEVKQRRTGRDGKGRAPLCYHPGTLFPRGSLRQSLSLEVTQPSFYSALFFFLFTLKPVQPSSIFLCRSLAMSNCSLVGYVRYYLLRTK